jgi:predicted transcriptional regulator
MKSYHNTNNLTGPDLFTAENQCKNQEIKVMNVFENNPNANLSVEQVWQMGNLTSKPITSIRRAITNLTTRGLLKKTDNMIIGMYGKPIHLWKLSNTNQ